MFVRRRLSVEAYKTWIAPQTLSFWRIRRDYSSNHLANPECPLFVLQYWFLRHNQLENWVKPFFTEMSSSPTSNLFVWAGKNEIGLRAQKLFSDPYNEALWYTTTKVFLKASTTMPLSPLRIPVFLPPKWNYLIMKSRKLWEVPFASTFLLTQFTLVSVMFSHSLWRCEISFGTIFTSLMVSKNSYSFSSISPQ
jgi:hypothetical protein